MGLTEILLMVLGAAIFVASLLIPEKMSQTTPRNTKAEEAKIRDFLEKEMTLAKNRFAEETEDSITAATEKAERFMERISNEKMMALNEYSDTVLDQIHKNHEETVFLYDMLNSKHDQLKQTAAEVTNVVKTAEQTVLAEENVMDTVAVASAPVESVQPEAVPVDSVQPVIENPVETVSTTEEVTEEVPKQEFAPLPISDLTVEVKRKKPTVRKRTATSKEKTSASAPRKEIEVQFDVANNGNLNNNEKILALHKAGKSNIAIAKELGLGMGEVKLVIDLFNEG
ncbi:MAG: DUF6115 domain-containing protein [Lachnospiraceae bacterium]|nr:DUF6115 domain-containing protein [Lachnospiraceae bacterium]